MINRSAPGWFEPAHAEYGRSYYVIEGYENTGSSQKMHALRSSVKSLA